MTKYIKCRHCGAENIFGAKTCDDCGKYLSGAKAEHNHDPHNGRCAWESDGHRCANAGTMTDSTKGSDRWYCSGHYGCDSAVIGHEIVLASIRQHGHNPDFSIEARRARSLSIADAAVPEVLRGWTVAEYRQNARLLLATVGKPKAEGRQAWAKKIIGMVARGEHVPYLTAQLAKQRAAEVVPEPALNDC